MPALSKMLGHHLPSHEKLKSWLSTQYNSTKSTISNGSASKSPRRGRDLIYNKTEMHGSHDSHLDLDGNNVERLAPVASSSPHEMGSMKKAVQTFISSGRHNVITDDGTHFVVELQQHSRQYKSV